MEIQINDTKITKETYVLNQKKNGIQRIIDPGRETCGIKAKTKTFFLSCLYPQLVFCPNL